MIEYQPTNDLVLLKELQEDQRMKGGVLLPDSSNPDMKTGEVMAVGLGAWYVTDKGAGRMPMSAKIGDKVIYAAGKSRPIYVSGDQYTIIKDSDIWLIKGSVE